MSKTIDFYFDYSSPFGYLASERIEAIAQKHDRAIVWHPLLLGAIFKVTKQAPLTQAPLKGDYSIHDFSRSAREHKLTYKHPDPFPIATVWACRATLWLRDNADASIRAHTTPFVHAVFRAFYTQGQDISDQTVLSTIASSLGIDQNQMGAALGEQSIKDALRREVDDAVNTGIFGSPMMIVDNEPFWGHDRLEQLDRWLDTGGW
ncbi:MAG: 2-hydroxychromene-2-carboxylate isomerase [Granulosicoccus sp.]